MKKMFWYVLIERYGNGAVKAAVIKNKLAVKCPPDFHKKEFGRELFGYWLETKAIAKEVVRQAKSLNKWRAA
jgi:hypothetical protein